MVKESQASGKLLFFFIICSFVLKKLSLRLSTWVKQKAKVFIYLFIFKNEINGENVLFNKISVNKNVRNVVKHMFSRSISIGLSYLGRILITTFLIRINVIKLIQVFFTNYRYIDIYDPYVCSVRSPYCKYRFSALSLVYTSLSASQLV